MFAKRVSVILLFGVSIVRCDAAVAFEAEIAREYWTPPYCQNDLFATELRCAPRADTSSDEQIRQLNKVDRVAAEKHKPYMDLFAWPAAR
ncbi:hypothetical protein [Methylocystis parvus]|uniref:DUF3551 domain-containing protein n=1 Tax=Methylocystis parvus TaxID=134 RepID=A0A6B8M9X6_9HYPH|nr:hypothetical protein [Methylocystis parvus]QGM99225.1 hypothetical protein F7D14_18210 [Methylocystis parvus]WBK00394.1 hypothetical protein MMG94_01315 [Methylocystis parvus OBBP]